jgi:peptidoglycan/xylan/chitin deacetylase (PgdA/CDA1 family)
VVTFDDGHADNFTNAFPILQRYDFNAAIFVTVGSIGNRLKLRSSVNPEGEPMLTCDQLKQLADNNIDIQSHGMTHSNLPELASEKVLWEMKESRKILEDIIERPVKYFCYPFGRFKPHHFEMAQEAGYRAAFSTFRGRRHSIAERWCLKRIPIHYGCSNLRFLSSIWLKSYRRSEQKLKTVLEK